MDTKVAIFGNLKGGVGKTTVTNIFARYVYHHSDLSVLVCDGDWDQATLNFLRTKDMAKFAEGQGVTINWKEDEDTADLEAQIPADIRLKFNKEVDKYRLITTRPADFPKTFKELKGKVDLILLDLPGSFAMEGVVQSYTMADVIIIPNNISDVDENSSKKFIKEVGNKVISLRENLGWETKIYYFLNKVNAQMKSVKEILAESKKLKGVTVMDSYLTDAKVDYQLNVSTIDFSDMSEKRFTEQVKPFCEEVLSIIKSL